ncbi:MAG: hypothetical protein Q9167_005611 [Letrouitia subvulpina]
MPEDGVHLRPDLPPAGAVINSHCRVDRDPDGAATEGLMERQGDNIIAAWGRRLAGEGQGPVRHILRAIDSGEDMAIDRVLNVVVEIDVAFFDQGGGGGEEEEEEEEKIGEGERMSVHPEERRQKKEIINEVLWVGGEK